MKWLHSDNVVGYVFIFPFIFSFCVFTIFPMLTSLYMSFTDYDLLGAPRWVGFDNYVHMLTSDSKFWQAMKVTFFYTFTAVPGRLIFALIVALLLVKVTRFAGMYRTALYIPSIIGGSVAVAVMWRQLFGNEGAINSFLELMGFEPVSWLGNASTAIWTLVVLYGWQFGSSMLIFLAGLKNIPQTYYEAASVDGANAWQRFYKITIPLLTPVILFNVVMQTIQGFMAFTPSYIITEGGPMNSTLLYVLYMFERAFTFFDMGYASAMAWVMLIIIAILTALIFKSSPYWVHYESDNSR
ncbi:ABC transporter permease [Novibacillus thermophilus]|uniref:ABC transporter permease n=1 Tax=Novibacillus thermophilus TaxID=1471761 RepID=A0A1U9KBG0_9BACL|nr:ABC transporter permease [Novibacillus thermophilus]